MVGVLWHVLILLVISNVNGLSLINAVSNIRIPFHVNIWVVGDSPNTYDKLESTLSELFSSYVPNQSKGIQFDNKFHVHFGGLDMLRIYENLIEDKEVEPHTVVEFISTLKEHVKSDMTFTPSHSNLPIVIILPNTILPPHTLTAPSNPEICSQTFIDDVLFVDLSASPCDLSSIVGKRNALLASGFTSDLWSSLYASQNKDMSMTSYTLLRTSSIIISAIKRFTLTNDLHYQTSFSANKIIVPIVFLDPRSTQEEAPLSDNQLTSIRLWLQNLLPPSQTALVFTATHHVEDHPQLTIALASASRWYVANSMSAAPDDDLDGLRRNTSRKEVRVPYLDSSQFVVELAQIGDTLCRRLMVDAGHNYEDDTLLAVEAFFQALGKDSSQIEGDVQYGIGDDMYYHHRHMTRSSKGTVVSPVFVLSDLLMSDSAMEADDDRVELLTHPMFDSKYSVVHTQGVTLVLHSTQETVNTHNPSTGRWTTLDLTDASLGIAEGLAQAVGGMSAPLIDRSSTGVDLTWLLGAHPFTPFGTLTAAHGPAHTHIAGVLTWSSRRSVAMSRGVQAIHTLGTLLDRAVAFVNEFSRPLSLLLPPSRRSIHRAASLTLSFPRRVDISQEGGIVALMTYIFTPIAFLEDINHLGNFTDSTGVSEPYISAELMQDIIDYKDLIRTVLVQMADIRQFIEEGASLLSATHVASAETNVENLQLRYREIERRLKETMDRCSFESLVDNTGKTSASLEHRRAEQNRRYMIAAGCVVLLLGGVLIMKKAQEAVEQREKKRI